MPSSPTPTWAPELLARAYYSDDSVVLIHGDCLDVLAALPAASVDAIVTDPPYGLGFMGKAWDGLPPGEPWARECLRVLKPGGHMLAFGGTRTWHRLAVAVEDAGFEMRDSIAWLYASGFPKSMDVGKAIDKRRDWSLVERLSGEIRRARAEAGLSLAEIGQATLVATDGTYGKWYHRGGHMFFETGRSLPSRPEWEHLRSVLPIAREFAEVYDEAEREVTGHHDAGNPIGLYAHKHGEGNGRTAKERRDIPATPDAQRWQGWGTALKPSHEPVVCARKPFNAVPLGEEVDRLHHLIGGLLWLSLSPAKRAELTSPSSTAGQHGATCVSALVSAALDTSPDASDETATFSSPALASTSSNIASSWSATLGALSARTRTSTTSTASNTTTALRTLNSLLGPITSQTTMPRCGCLVAGPSSPAPSAASSSSDEWAKWLHTLSASVPATATEGIALAVASALASIAADLSGDQAAASSAAPTATTGAAARGSTFEPVVVARKPLAGTVAANVLAHGTGALNIAATRVGSGADKGIWPKTDRPTARNSMAGGPMGHDAVTDRTVGRWPANVILDGHAADELDRQGGDRTSGVLAAHHVRNPKESGILGAYGSAEGERGYGDSGGASRFFPTFRYEAKAHTAERPDVGGVRHPTVKPLDLMRWLVRLVTPPGGLVLDPFAGSGTTGEACVREGFRCVLIERETDYLPLIVQRLGKPMQLGLDFGGGVA